MSKRYWTADLHLGHSNIIEYCNRPFKDCHHMNCRLVDEANMRLKPDDICVHVGDFCTKGGDAKASVYQGMLNGQWVFVRGNHDKNNGVKTVCWWMLTQISTFNVFVSHVPYFYKTAAGTAQHLIPESLVNVIESTCNFAICGHVHYKWLISHEGKIPTINVGVDVHKFRPISDDELVNIYLKNKRGNKYREVTT